MPAVVKAREINWLAPIRIRFGFTGLNDEQAIPIVRRLLQEQWPETRRPKQCAYVIRLRGEVAVDYGRRHSPVLYIGEGNAFGRLYSHARWISDLLISVPNLEVEVFVAQVLRRRNPTLYRHFEADMIGWFRDEYGHLPWFNRQSETNSEGEYLYTREAEKKLRCNLMVGSGNKFRWAIRPTPVNPQYESYCCGIQLS